MYSYGPHHMAEHKAGQQDWNYIEQLCEDKEYSLEDRPKAMNDRERWRERVRDIRADGMTKWLWTISALCQPK